MQDITFKVAQKGEGKTKWLLHIAKNCAEVNKKVALFTTNEAEYKKFCEKYFKSYSEFCHVSLVNNITDFSSYDVILIDDLLKQELSLPSLRTCGSKLFITIEGTTKVNMDKGTWDSLYEQLTIIDAEEAVNA